MALSVGTRLGPYEIVAPLGSGGMGEVYRANDTRLDRIVAIKVLASHLSSNPDLRQRFEREARAVSSLNHPHICTLHDIGHQDGTDYLVMEYLEGETLAERLNKGALPLDQVLRYSVQIAGALERAHRQGIVHRDLKPGNIMLTRSGAKVLDFGLAKHAAPPISQSILSGMSALKTEEARNLTAEGTIVGTFQYMSPEQLEGNEADARSDIFALGTVIYEMTTGKRPFTGKSPASLIAAILAAEPQPLTAIQPMAPPVLDYIVRKCLAKDPEDRWQSAQDLASQIQWALDQRSQISVAPQPIERRVKRDFVWILAGIFFVISFILLVERFLQGTRTAPLTEMSILLPVDSVAAGAPAASPDGRMLVFQDVTNDGKRMLWLRSFDSTKLRALPGTEGGEYPFWSPDGRWIAFFAEGKLKKIEIATEQIHTLCDAGDAMLARGGTWSSKGTILFANAGVGVRQLFGVPETGGDRIAATTLDPSVQEASHRWPFFLPDGRHFLYNIRSAKPENTGIFVGSLDSKEKKRLLPDVSRMEYAAGYLFFVRDDNLMIQPFDVNHLTLSGKALPLVENVLYVSTGRASFSVSGHDVLVYQPPGSFAKTQLTWVDRTGKPGVIIGPSSYYRNPSLSPDGSKLAVGIIDPSKRTEDLWIVDLIHGRFYRLTSDPASEWSPIWSPDGTEILFESNRAVAWNVYRKSVSGGGNEELLIGSLLKWMGWPVADDWSPDGRYILFERDTDLWLFPLSGDRKEIPYVQSEFNKFWAQFSPDGKYVAYVSDETGRNEVYVRPFPNASAGKWQISSGGGLQPKFSHDGKELLYLSPDKKLMRVEIRAGPTFEFGSPTELLEAQVEPYERWSNENFGNYYVPSLDGKSFLINRVVEPTKPSPFTVVFNWPAEVKR